MSSSQFSTQNDLLLINLKKFFKMNNNLKKMLDIINGESKISLRIVDWFATNYAKKNFSVYTINQSNGMKERFNVYRDYKLKLKAYSKRRFDPFCRWERINIPYQDTDKFIQTTIGQLNFFKWAIENNIINYIKKNIKDVENDMNLRCEIVKKVSTKIKKNDDNNINIINSETITNTNTNLKTKKIGITTRKKRKEISAPSSKSLSIHNLPMTINFD